MDLLKWAPIVTGIVAIYAAVLSTYNLVASRLDRAHKLRVSLKWGMVAPGPEPETVLILEAINPRGRSVTVAACALVLPNRKALVIPHPVVGSAQLPHELVEGTNCRILFPLRDVVVALQGEGFTGQIALRALFRDALGNEYLSKKFKGDLREWASVAADGTSPSTA